ncbi:hypothetical protein BYT27DRAFT_7239363 [Phlegmacium glaucopus]|nr:hypothetical protein BYT27DRAFT_7239363 [Phlegmacium glaucopus]
MKEWAVGPHSLGTAYWTKGINYLGLFNPVFVKPPPLNLKKVSALNQHHSEIKHIFLSIISQSIIHNDIKGDNILMSGVPPGDGQPNFELNDHYLTFSVILVQPESPCTRSDYRSRVGYKADIWNFGCLVYKFARGYKLFDPHWDNEKSGMNPTQAHLYLKIVGLCGDSPPEFLDNGRKSKFYFDDQGCRQYLITLRLPRYAT